MSSQQGTKGEKEKSGNENTARNSERGKTKAKNSRIRKRLEDEQQGWCTKDG